jgi:alpha-glucosidase
VRAGAILPLGPVVQHTTERPLDEITLLIYPDGASRFELYEDDGRTNAYRQGHHALTPFECLTGPDGVTVRIGEPVGDRSVVPDGRRYLIRLRSDPPASVILDGHGALPRLAGPSPEDAGWWVDGREFVGIRLPHQPVATVTIRTTI